MDDSPGPAAPEPSERGLRKVRRIVLGKPKDIEDPGLFHALSLAAFLAWVGPGADAVFSSLPASTHWLKLPSAVAVIALLTVLNLRGVKESVSTLVPVFLVFLATHVVMIGGSVFFHLGRAGEVAREVSTGLSHD